VVSGRAAPDGVTHVRRFTGPHGSTIHLAVAQAAPAQRRHPVSGRLRIWAGAVADADARRLARRLAREMRISHEIHRTGFRGAEIVVTGVRCADPVLLRSVAELLGGHHGTLFTGADLGITAGDLATLSAMTPYVFGAGRDTVAATATAFGVLGAIEAWAGGPVAGLRVLVHGTGKVGGELAARLAAAGAIVAVHDVRPGATVPPGCHRVSDWTGHPVDVLAPCSAGDLIDAPLAHRLSCGAVIGSAGAVLADEAATCAVLHRRGITYLPTPLVNAGAAITHSIEHYAPQAYRRASADAVYDFVRRAVRSAAADLAEAARRAGLSPSAVLLRRRREPPAGRIRGLEFRTSTDEPEPGAK
jgi:leucine dehydrogenase